MTRILACIDASIYATSVIEHAAWAAERLEAEIEVLHVIQRKDAVAARHDLSGAVGLGAKSALLDELTRIDEAEGKLAQDKGRALLASAKEHLGGRTGVTLTHRHGDIVETIVEREAEAELVVIGKRGASADFAKGHLGSKVERVVRQSRKAVLVANRAFKQLEGAVIAFDGGPSARKALAYVATSPLFRDMRVRVVMAGRDEREDRDRLACPTELFARRPGAEVLHRQGKPEDVIRQEVEASGAQLLVMGAYGHSPLRSMLVGSTTTEMIRSCTIPVMLFR
jgi:nucleotide-binding universal stress UspA family protein